MKRAVLLITIILLISGKTLLSQHGNDTLVYLVTCGPGTETYSIYGHSAVRIVIQAKKTDNVYNWGMFDFDTPNFAWKFAKGRLDYLLGVETMNGFLQTYFYEKRFVHSQRMNITPSETKKLMILINENLKPENVKYRYDFFYDDCSTRIRDLIENTIGDKLLYPPASKEKSPTFRAMTGKYQDPFPWLNFGIDLIMGSPGDKRASYRDRMFLPIDLENELSETVVNRDGKMVPLLQNPDVVLDYPPPVIKQNFILMPAFIFTVVLIIVLIISAMVKNERIIYLFDIFVFLAFSILASMMIFFNFFTDHLQMRWNLNIIWLNPVIIICLVYIILKRKSILLFRLLFYILAAFIPLHLILPQSFNIAFLPLVVILLIRSSVRADLDWNPLTPH